MSNKCIRISDCKMHFSHLKDMIESLLSHLLKGKESTHLLCAVESYEH